MYTSEYDRKYRSGGYRESTVEEIDNATLKRELAIDTVYNDKISLEVSQEDKKFNADPKFATMTRYVSNNINNEINLSAECKYLNIDYDKCRAYLREWCTYYGYELDAKRGRGTIIRKIAKR